jgi:hypothetical protein
MHGNEEAGRPHLNFPGLWTHRLSARNTADKAKVTMCHVDGMCRPLGPRSRLCEDARIDLGARIEFCSHHPCNGLNAAHYG